MNTKLTIILPVYNAEATIGSAIRSVLAQTMQLIRLIVVDDGSTDNTPMIVDAFAKKDNRVTVIHQENQGCYTSRVNGIKLVQTPYFGFMDADDLLCNDYYERMLDFIEENDLDVVQCDFYTSKPDARVRPNEILRGKREVFEKVIMPRLIEGRGAVVLWDKIYKRSLIPACLIESPVFYFEDIVLNWQLLHSASSFGYLHQELYGYTQNFKPYKRKGFDDLLWTDRFRRKYANLYGLQGCEIEFSKWMVHNAKNFMMVALRTYSNRFVVRCRDAREISEHEQVFQAYRDLLNIDTTYDGMVEISYARSWILPFWAMIERLKSIIYPPLLTVKHMVLKPKAQHWS